MISTSKSFTLEFSWRADVDELGIGYEKYWDHGQTYFFDKFDKFANLERKKFNFRFILFISAKLFPWTFCRWDSDSIRRGSDP